MGVGTYGNDYGGAGRSINVSGPLPCEEDYLAYLKDQDGDDAMTREEFDRDAYDYGNEEVLDTVAEVGRALGFSPERSGRFGGAACNFDRKITCISSGGYFEMGWRSWEHDFVVAIGPSEDFLRFLNGGEDDPDSVEWAVTEKGRAPVRLKSDYEAVLGDLETLVRYRLLDNGIGTSVKTSGYTSRADEKPENLPALCAALEAKVKEGLAKLERGRDEVFPSLPVDERLELAAAVMKAEWGGSFSPRVVVAAYDPEECGITTWNPADGKNGLLSGRRVPDGMLPYLAALPVVGGLAAIPFAPETEGLFASMQCSSHMIHIAVSAEQYAAISGEPCSVTWENGDTGETGTIVLHEGSPAPAPSR